MTKAILELEMPKSCAECPCKDTDVWGMVRCRLIHMKNDKYSGMAEGYAYKRRPDCPLKLVEDKEKHGKWVLHGNDDDLGMTYYCSVCGFDLNEDLFYSGYEDGKWIRNHVFKHCPNCGARMDE